MITLILTNKEALRLRKALENGGKDPDLARVHFKLEAQLKRPACKRKYDYPDPPPNPFRWDADE